jgi:hypothetical protein
MLLHQTRNNNGEARAREAEFCGNAACGGDSLLDDLRFHAGSTSYGEGEKERPNRRRINGLQNSG